MTLSCVQLVSMSFSSASHLLAILAAVAIAKIGCAAQLIGGESCRMCLLRQPKYTGGSEDTDLKRKNEQLYADYRELNALLREIESLEKALDRQKSKGNPDKATLAQYSNHHIKRDLKCDENTSAEEDVSRGRSGEEADMEPKICVPRGGVAVKDYLDMLDQGKVYNLGVQLNPWRIIPGYNTKNLLLY